ncbi:MAG: S8 family serine peptidase, partial [Gemmatimonadetes bacterium]|nr:S8 family serine peptidase [Gemmatimonadota bacterium]
MRRFGFATAAAACIALAACSNDTTGPSALAPTAPHRDASAADGRYVVMFKNGIPASFATKVQSLGGSVDFSHDGAGIAIVSGVGDAGAAQLGALSGVSEVQADAEVALDQPQAAAEADLGTELDDAAASPTNPTLASRYAWQWNMRLIHANNAWAAGKLGSANVTVAIIDTGIDYDIRDLNGLVDLSRSVSFVPSDNAITSTYFPSRNPISDYNGHGTNVATQVSSNGIALAGVTSRTRLIGVKVLARDGRGSLGAILAGVTWAADHGANVANMSLGGAFAKAGNGRFVGLINRTFNYANRKGMLIVVAAGNDSEDLDHNGNQLNTYCNLSHVVCVSSVGPATVSGDPNTSSYFTNYGRSAITVAAPGGNADAANGFTRSAWPWGSDIASWVWSFCSKTRIAGFTSTGAPVLTACAAGNR